MVLTVDKRVSQPVAGAGEGRVVVEGDVVPAVEVRDPLPAQVFLAMDIPVRSADGKTSLLRMCDYASAGRTWDAQSMLRVWLPQPLDLADPLNGVQAPPQKH